MEVSAAAAQLYTGGGRSQMKVSHRSCNTVAKMIRSLHRLDPKNYAESFK